jgi:hypothetical protein
VLVPVLSLRRTFSAHGRSPVDKTTARTLLACLFTDCKARLLYLSMYSSTYVHISDTYQTQQIGRSTHHTHIPAAGCMPFKYTHLITVRCHRHHLYRRYSRLYAQSQQHVSHTLPVSQRNRTSHSPLHLAPPSPKKRFIHQHSTNASIMSGQPAVCIME